MKKLTVLFVLIALLALVVTPMLASNNVKGKISQNGRIAIREELTQLPEEMLQRNIPPMVGTGQSRTTALAGMYSIGLAAPPGYVANYLKLRDAVAALQLGGVSGAVTFEFTDPAYVDSNVTIGGYIGQDLFPVTFQLSPSNPGAEIVFTGGINTWGVRFYSAMNVTWQGTTVPWIKPFDQRPLKLTIDTLSVRRNVIVFMHGNNKNIMLKDMVLTGWRKGSGTLGPYGIVYEFDGTATAADTGLYFYNLKLQRGAAGFNFGGPTVNFMDDNIIVQGCEIGSTPYPNNLTIGIQASTGTNYHFVQNEIHGIYAKGVAPEATTPIGMQLGFANMQQLWITHNIIHDIERTAGSGAVYGILCAPAAPNAMGANWYVLNNMIYDLRYFGIRAAQYQDIWAIALWGPGVGGPRVYNNSINITGSLNPLSPGWATDIFISGLSGTDLVRNGDNIFATSLLTPAGSGSYCVYYDVCPYLTNNNVYWPSGPDAGVYNGGDLTALQADCLQDDYSVVGDPGFVPPALHIDHTTMGFVSPANALAFPLAYVTDDIDHEARDPLTPDAGADEFTPTPWPHDALPIAVFSPVVTGIPEKANLVQPSVRIRNNGANADQIPVRLRIYNGLGDQYNQLVTVLVDPLSYFDLPTEFAKLPAIPPGSYTVELKTELATDMNPNNDILLTSTMIVEKRGAKYATDFENGPDGWMSIATSGPDDFVLGTPPPNKTFITAAHSGVNCWYTAPGDSYSWAMDVGVYSPYFDLTNNPFPIIKFWHKFDTEPAYDATGFEYTVDFGVTWLPVGDFPDPKGINWYTGKGGSYTVSPGWNGNSETVYGTFNYVQSQYYAKGIGGLDQVRFRYHFISDGNTVGKGVGFDDFEINNAPSISGVVYNDVDGNGVFSQGDIPFVQDTVFLNEGLDGAQFTLTDNNGLYEFENLIEGLYTVSTHRVFGTISEPASHQNFVEVQLTKDVVFVVNFGFFNPMTVKGIVWYDKNHNQLMDPGEDGMAQIPVSAVGPGGTYTASSGSDGSYIIVIKVPGNYNVAQGTLPTGYIQVFPKDDGYIVTVDFGTAITDKNFGNSASLTEALFYAPSYTDWATSVDAKTKFKSIKRKNDKVWLKFNMVAPKTATGVKIKFGMLASGALTLGKDKLDTVANIDNVKEFTYTPTAAIDSGATIQFDGYGWKGKAAKVKIEWATLPRATKVTLTEYKHNEPQLPYPNLHNVGEELFSQQYFPTAGLVLGIPQGDKGVGSVQHAKYKDVMKTLESKGIYHDAGTQCLDTYATKILKKYLKYYEPKKQKNMLVAELLVLKLNVAASDLGKLPYGLGLLTYLDKSNPGNLFNNQVVNDIILKADTMLACMTVTSKADTPTLAELYGVLHAINTAFNGKLDTVSFAEKTKLKGVIKLKDCPYLYATPGMVIAPKADLFRPTPIPLAYTLGQNYPNPFNPTTTIEFELPTAGTVTLKVYNMLGQEVRTLIDNVQYDEGQDFVDFDASGLSSGVYFYRLTVQAQDDEGLSAGTAFTQIKKMVLMK